MNTTPYQDTINKLAKGGYAVKGVIYLTVSLLALNTAFLGGGDIQGSKGAIQTIAAQPFGQFLMVLVTIGLIAYALWRLASAVLNPQGWDDDAKGIAKRVGAGASAILYGGLAYSAIKLLTGSGSSGGDKKETMTAWLMSLPMGRWLVGLFGVAVLIAAMYQFYKATQREKIFNLLDERDMSTSERSLAMWSGRVGFTSRGVVWILIGAFLVQAALAYNSNKVGGLEAALTEIATQPYGDILLGLTALGMVGYAFYCFVKTRYLSLQSS